MASIKPVSGSFKSLTATAFKDYREVLKRYLLRRVQRPEDAEDLAQEVFELYLRKRDHEETVRDPLSYLFRIAFHVVGDALRRGKRGVVTFDSTLVEAPLHPAASDYKSPVEEDCALKDEIAQALKKLPQSQASALMLVEGQGMSYREAAQALGLSPNSVAVYVSQARAALKLSLDAHHRGSRR